MPITEIELSAQDIRDQQEELARTVGSSVHDAYERMDAGEFRGTILEAELHMLRFLLDDGPAGADAIKIDRKHCYEAAWGRVIANMQRMTLVTDERDFENEPEPFI